jgi:hypothetical protein
MQQRDEQQRSQLSKLTNEAVWQMKQLTACQQELLLSQTRCEALTEAAKEADQAVVELKQEAVDLLSINHQQKQQLMAMEACTTQQVHQTAADKQTMLQLQQQLSASQEQLAVAKQLLDTATLAATVPPAAHLNVVPHLQQHQQQHKSLCSFLQDPAAAPATPTAAFVAAAPSFVRAEGVAEAGPLAGSRVATPPAAPMAPPLQMPRHGVLACILQARGRQTEMSAAAHAQ